MLYFIHKLLVFKGTELNQIIRPEQLKTLSNNSVKLIEIMECSYGLDHLLVENNCISKQHREAIDSKKGARNKNKELLKIIQRRSNLDFLTFIECLRDENIKQNHVAELLLWTAGNIFKNNFF